MFRACLKAHLQVVTCEEIVEGILSLQSQMEYKTNTSRKVKLKVYVS